MPAVQSGLDRGRYYGSSLVVRGTGLSKRLAVGGDRPAKGDDQPVLYVSEFLLLALLLCVVRPELRREPFFIAGVATLLLLPLFRYGTANDLARGVLVNDRLTCNNKRGITLMPVAGSSGTSSQ